MKKYYKFFTMIPDEFIELVSKGLDSRAFVIYIDMCKRSREIGNVWVSMTNKEVVKLFGESISERTADRIISNMVEHGIIEIQNRSNKKNGKSLGGKHRYAKSTYHKVQRSINYEKKSNFRSEDKQKREVGVAISA